MSTSTPAISATAERPEDRKLPVLPSLGYGMQHILSMFGGVIAVPLIVGGAAGLEHAQLAVLISSALLVSGLATILQTIGLPRLGAQLPLVQGISFASVSTLVTVVAGKGQHGLTTALGATIVAAAAAFLIVSFFAQITRFFPPVVTGSIITVIGLSLLPVAAGWITGQKVVAGHANADYAKASNVLLALFTLAVVLVLSRFARTSRMAVLLGLAVGTAVALVTGQADFDLKGASVVALPSPLAFGTPTFEIGAIISMFLVMLVIMAETTADILAVGDIVETEVGPRRVADGLRADMLASAVAPVFNTFPSTAFAQNVGLVALTGVKSRYVVAAGGGILALLGLSPALAALVQVIPQPVLGGAGIMLFGSVAASGIKTLASAGMEGHDVLVVAVAVSFGILPTVAPDFWSDFPHWLGAITHSGITAATIVAVVLNAALRGAERVGRRHETSPADVEPNISTTGATA